MRRLADLTLENFGPRTRFDKARAGKCSPVSWTHSNVEFAQNLYYQLQKRGARKELKDEALKWLHQLRVERTKSEGSQKLRQ